MTSLQRLEAGATGRVMQLGGPRSFRRRLMELGLLPGTQVRVVRRVGVGNLMEVEVRGCHLSLRASEAADLWVETEA